MTPPSEQRSSEPVPMRELLYRRHEGGDSDDLNEAARGWLDAVRMFATEALTAGTPASEVLPAVIQMLEGWMVARDAASLATTWMALDGAVTVLERRLAEMRDERDRLASMTGTLLAEKAARRARRQRRKRRGGGKGKG
jgi:hypothetical protein